MIASCFDPDEVECLVRTVAETVGNTADDFPDLSSRQRFLAERAHDLLTAEYDGQESAPPVTALSPYPRRQVWVLRRWDQHGNKVSLHADEAAGLDELARHARAHWDDPACAPPTGDREAVDLFYGPAGEGTEKGYSLYAETITSQKRTRLLPLPRRFPGADECERANTSALFLPTDGPSTLPCLQIKGVQAYLYLDAGDQAVRVAVHLDTTDEGLLNEDGTVPLEVVVSDTVLLERNGRTGPASAVLAELLAAADADQSQAIRQAAVTAGLMWCCRCGHHNPAAALRCTNCSAFQPESLPRSRHVF